MVSQATMGIQENSNNEGIDIEENIITTVNCVNGMKMMATQYSDYMRNIDYNDNNIHYIVIPQLN